MYSREDRIKAVKLYIRYDFSVAEVRRELGYPACHRTMRIWHQDYLEELETGVIKEPNARMRTYTDEQKRTAVDYYLSHGRSLARTMRNLGYPSKPTLVDWIEDLAPEGRKRSRPIQCSYEQKKAAVIDLCTRDGTAREVATEHGIDRDTIYRWKYELLGKEQGMPMSSKPDPISENPKDLLKAIAETESSCCRFRSRINVLSLTRH